MSLESTEPKPLVLVVDDDESIRRMVRLSLQQRFEVVEAENGTAAIAQVQARDFDVAVVDVMMPGMSGIEACPKLKAAAKGPLPVLLLTALDDQESRNAGLSAGADDYLAKPVDRRELQLRVQHFVRLRRQEQLIRRQLGSLSELQALKDDLTALLVHDLRNPLTAVRSAFHLLQANLAPQDREVYELGRHALDRVMEGVSDLLKVRMLERGQLTLTREQVPLEPLLRNVVRGLEAAALDGDIRVQVEVTSGLEASLDVKLVSRAIENLLINAFRHTKERVDVSARPCVLENGQPGVELEVADRGPGVPDYLKGELFDMFGSLALQKAGGRKGHGLGLYLVRLVATAHGGQVKVLDRPGGGAAFVMQLGIR